jgi:hypothetical protein
LSEKIEGFVIKGDEGSFLDEGRLWREIPVRDAPVHLPETIEDVRQDMHHCPNYKKPKLMYHAIRINGVTIITGPPISFYVVSGGSQPFVGDCAQFTN